MKKGDVTIETSGFELKAQQTQLPPPQPQKHVFRGREFKARLLKISVPVEFDTYCL